MKIPRQFVIGAVAALMLQPACAATIYSGLLNTTIPNDFAGVTININGGTANFFFGGVGVANNNLLQPFRDGTGNLDTLLNFSEGDVLGASTTYIDALNGSGGSQDHVGTTFTAGQVGYIGFKLNGTDYGWMRVLFTNNEGGAKVLEYAYDNSAASIGVGGIRQTGQDILLTMTFALATSLADVGGTTNVIKSGSGTTTTLQGTNTYTGTTTVSGGSLAISGTGSIANSPLIQINNSSTLSVTGLTGGNFTIGATQTVAGTGTILATGKTVESNGTLSPGSGPGTLTQDGGTLKLGAAANMNWQIVDGAGLAGTGYDTVNLTNGAALDLSSLSVGNPYNINLWSLSGVGPDTNGNANFFNNTQNYAWTLFSTDAAISGFAANKFIINVAANNGAGGFGNALGGGSFSVGLADGGTNLVLNFTAIPEPCTALLGCLGLLLILRRRR